ncbi:hypothetical protein [Novacetimonas cocois]|uniref:hypothetical protein n=1 Tax=Novacetimonas cocois TaxID=1747507 RepID=UPI001057BCBD|nr:hypothetical protein [Novacetimonas cocois]
MRKCLVLTGVFYFGWIQPEQFHLSIGSEQCPLPFIQATVPDPYSLIVACKNKGIDKGDKSFKIMFIAYCIKTDLIILIHG